MNVRIYDEPNIPPLVAQELLALLQDSSQNATFAALAFYAIINRAVANRRLPGGGIWLSQGASGSAAMLPPGSIVMHLKYDYRLYYTYSQQLLPTEMRVVLVANGRDPEAALVSESIKRHNCM